MARGSGICRRSRRMRPDGKMCSSGSAVMDPHGGGSLDLKPASADSEVDKPRNVGSAEEGWIYVRGHRIKNAGLHIDSHGNVYVPDSEDEESSMQDQAGDKDLPVQEPPVPGVNEDSRMEVPTEVPEELKEVLANMDPIYHDVSLTMYKILVPIYLRPFRR